MITTLQVEKSTKNKLDELKINNRETYNEIIRRLIMGVSLANATRESLIATIETLSDPEEMREIAGALEEIQKGNFGQSIGQVEKELL